MKNDAPTPAALPVTRDTGQQPAALFQAWADSAPEIIFVVDRSRRLTYVNPFACRLLEQPPDVLVGKLLTELFPPPDARIQRRHLTRVIVSGISQYHEDRLHFKDRAFWLGTRLIPVRDPGGKIHAVLGVARDITRQKSLEKALEENEKKFRYLSEEIPDGVAVLTDQKFFWLNRALAEIFGVPREAITGRELTDFFEPPDVDRIIQIGRLGRRKKAGPVFFEIRTRGGTRQGLPVAVHAKPIDLWGQEAIQILVRNQTEYHRVLEALRDSERLYRNLLEQLPGVVYIADPQKPGALRYVSPQITSLIGYTPKEWLADVRLLHRHLHPEDRRRVLAAVNRAVKTGTPFLQEYRLVTREGKTVWVFDQGRPVKDDTGRLLYFQGINVDVTRRKQAEERYRTLFENSEDGIVITTEAGQILDLNQACRRLFGIKKKEDPTRFSAQDFYARKPDREVYIRIMKRKGFVRNYEILYRKTDGTLFTGTLTATRQQDGSGNPIFFGIVRDISQLKKNETMLQDSRRELKNLSEHLQSLLEKEKQEISRRIHDELGQHLTALKMDLHWLHRRFSPRQPLLGKKVEAMSQIVDSTIHTVQNICEELRPALLDNLGLVDALEWQIKNFRRRTGLEISFSVSPRRLPLSGEDATLVFRLFQEIMNNIFLHAQATRVKIALKKDGNLVKLDIRDNGRGITEAQINHPRSFGIMGMRERVDARGGRISIRGLAGKGTAVAIQIPLNQKGETS